MVIAVCNRNDTASFPRPSSETRTLRQRLAMRRVVNSVEESSSDFTTDSSSNTHEDPATPLVPLERRPWREASHGNKTFIRYLSPSYLQEDFNVEEAHVFGKGRLGIGLYSMDCLDAYEILHKRLEADEVRLGRSYKHETDEKQKALQLLVETLQMLAYVEYRMSCMGPYTPVDKSQMDRRLQFYANKHNLWDKAVTLPSAFHYTHPEFPDSLTSYHRGKKLGPLTCRVNPMSPMTHNEIW